MAYKHHYQVVDYYRRPEQVAKRKARYVKKRALIRAQAKARYRKNKDEVLTQKRHYHVANREIILRKRRQWWKSMGQKINKQRRKSYPSKREAILATSTVANRQLKIEVLAHYSDETVPRCACCGESHIEFLFMDHSNGGGKQHRAQLKIRGRTKFFCVFKRSGYPQGYGVLCMNCNMARSLGRTCPHEVERSQTKAV